MEARLQSHDKFFKYLLSDLDRARTYLRAYLPEELTAILNLETLQLEDGTFIDDRLKESLSDLVFSVTTQQGNPANLCFLLEHKSRPDPTAVFQILHYISGAMLRRARNGEEQRLVVPILFYHGEKTWAYQPLESFFPDLPEILRPYLPAYEYLYHNFNALPDDEIRTLPNRLLVSALLVMKHFYETGYLQRNSAFLLLGGYDEQGNFYPPLFVYFFSKMQNRTGEYKQILAELPPPLKSKIMSTLDYLIEKGEKKGEKKGLEKGKELKNRQACTNMIRLGFDDELICKIQEVTPEFVQNLRQELKEQEDQQSPE